MSNASLDQIQHGTAVYDVDGNKVGSVAEYDSQGQYLMVQKGLLFPKDIYIPTSAVQRADNEGVYLSLSKTALDDERYHNVPEQTAGATMAAGTAATTGYAEARTTATDTATTDRDISVPVREEELVVGKREEEVGRVHLHKDVVEEQQTVSAPVMHEEVTVERIPMTGQGDVNTADAFVERDIDVPVMGEELVAGKRAVVTEEVRLHKQTLTEEEQVSDTVRKERVTVENEGNLTAEDMNTNTDRTQR